MLPWCDASLQEGCGKDERPNDASDDGCNKSECWKEDVLSKSDPYNPCAVKEKSVSEPKKNGEENERENLAAVNAFDEIQLEMRGAKID